LRCRVTPRFFFFSPTYLHSPPPTENVAGAHILFAWRPSTENVAAHRKRGRAQTTVRFVILVEEAGCVAKSLLLLLSLQTAALRVAAHFAWPPTSRGGRSLRVAAHIFTWRPPTSHGGRPPKRGHRGQAAWWPPTSRGGRPLHVADAHFTWRLPTYSRVGRPLHVAAAHFFTWPPTSRGGRPRFHVAVITQGSMHGGRPLHGKREKKNSTVK
jgi:hypothetical protein